MARKGPLPPLLLINPASTVTVRRDGQWQTIGPLKALVADVGDLNIVHRTVFSRPKESVNAPQLSPCAHQTEGQTNPTVCDRRVLREEGTQRRVGRQRRYTDHIVSSRRMGTDASSNVGGVISAKRGTCSQRLSSTGRGYGRPSGSGRGCWRSGRKRHTSEFAKLLPRRTATPRFIASIALQSFSDLGASGERPRASRIVTSEG